MKIQINEEDAKRHMQLNPDRGGAMAKQSKDGKIIVYFRESDKDFLNKIKEEAHDTHRPASQILLDYARLGFGREFREGEMLCERCGGEIV